MVRVPQQVNKVDCGVYVCMFIKELVRRCFEDMEMGVHPSYGGDRYRRDMRSVACQAGQRQLLENLRLKGVVLPQQPQSDDDREEDVIELDMDIETKVKDLLASDNMHGAQIENAFKDIEELKDQLFKWGKSHDALSDTVSQLKQGFAMLAARIGCDTQHLDRSDEAQGFVLPAGGIPGAGVATAGGITVVGAATLGGMPGAGGSTAGLLPGEEVATSGGIPGAGVATSGMIPVAGVSTAGFLPGAGVVKTGGTPGAGVATSGMIPGAGVSTAGFRPGAGVSAAGLLPGAGAATCRGIPGAEVARSGGIPGAGVSPAGLFPGEGVATASGILGAGVDTAGGIPGAGVATSGGIPGAGVSAAGLLPGAGAATCSGIPGAEVARSGGIPGAGVSPAVRLKGEGVATASGILGAGVATAGGIPGAGVATPVGITNAGVATSGGIPGAGVATPVGITNAGVATSGGIPGAGVSAAGLLPGAGAATCSGIPGAEVARSGGIPGAGAAPAGLFPGAGVATAVLQPCAGVATACGNPGAVVANEGGIAGAEVATAGGRNGSANATAGFLQGAGVSAARGMPVAGVAPALVNTAAGVATPGGLLGAPNPTDPRETLQGHRPAAMTGPNYDEDVSRAAGWHLPHTSNVPTATQEPVPNHAIVAAPGGVPNVAPSPTCSFTGVGAQSHRGPAASESMSRLQSKGCKPDIIKTQYTGVTRLSTSNTWTAKIVLQRKTNSQTTISSKFRSDVEAARAYAAGWHLVWGHDPSYKGNIIELSAGDIAKLQGCDARMCKLMIEEKFWHRWENWRPAWEECMVKLAAKERKNALKQAELQQVLASTEDRPGKKARTGDDPQNDAAGSSAGNGQEGMGTNV
ncbi:unnamed protein product [Closterium sp. Naga37s-1]|nr:unnamed protein product [Closterium sp. Naga37s-1]